AQSTQEPPRQSWPANPQFSESLRKGSVHTPSQPPPAPPAPPSEGTHAAVPPPPTVELDEPPDAPVPVAASLPVAAPPAPRTAADPVSPAAPALPPPSPGPDVTEPSQATAARRSDTREAGAAQWKQATRRFGNYTRSRSTRISV